METMEFIGALMIGAALGGAITAIVWAQAFGFGEEESEVKR